MNSQGEIKLFKPNEPNTTHPIPLTDELAEKLERIPDPEARVSEALWQGFHLTVLKGRKLESLEKLKYKGAIKFAVHFLLNQERGK